MFELVEVKDSVKIPPKKIGKDLEEAIKESLGEELEGRIYKDVGIVLSIEKILEIGENRIFPGDENVYYQVSFELLAYRPIEHEVVIGQVVDITEFGVFVRTGPIDALVHVSQVMDDYVNYDEKNSILSARKSSRTLKEGDLVRARIISISMGKESKVGLTMRQPGLGALRWIEQEKEEKKVKQKKK